MTTNTLKILRAALDALEHATMRNRAMDISTDELSTLIASLEAQPVGEPTPPFGTQRKAAMAVYKAPFVYKHGYIYDSQNLMVADNGGIGKDAPGVEGAVAARVRGWGRLGYLPNGAELQDEIGQMMADALNAVFAAPVQPVEQPKAVPLTWRPIATAPKDGGELLGWREDCGVILIRWTSCSELMTDPEIEKSGIDDETLFAEDWFCADLRGGSRLEGSEIPTHWMPLPEAPKHGIGGGND